jgi:hypothetical protein
MNDISNVKEIAEQLPPLYNIGVFDGRGGRLRWLTPGVEYTPARPDGPLTLYQCFVDYTKEHCVPEGGDPERAWIAFRVWIAALGHDRDVTTLTRADGRRLVEHELARGVSSATARKHLTMGQAALHHAQREERITKVPKFQSPAPIHLVAQMLGDKVEMIERVYSHVLPTDLQDVTRVLH